MTLIHTMIAGLGLASAASLAATAQAQDFETGGKLLLTRGISTIEGSGGGGLSSWALITGNETERGIGGTAHATQVELEDFRFQSAGFAIGIHDRFELSWTRQRFDTQDAGAALGLGQGFTFEQDVIGAKIRLFGDAVYDQDSWVPQVALGVQHKSNNQGAIVRAVGAADDSGYDVYLAATKLLLEHSLLLNATLRWTEANQTGLLGYGGLNDHSLQGEFSAGYMLSRRFIIGAEYRFKPDNLGFAGEDDWVDLFAAYAVNQHLTVTAAWVDLGSIATFDDQRGFYLSLQAGF
ncbi:DUF3034 family protein [uncultured Maricaulis sp.]|uniref:DUF3034 family protein n=1 Tax=uncultured Maricaulis sp. TaxID=174710 RepID=UPI002610327C|nr:DUF3034 family protein [uncultured Maricaulis sp.]